MINTQGMRESAGLMINYVYVSGGDEASAAVALEARQHAFLDS